MDPGIPVARPRLQQKHAMAAVRRQPVGEDASRRAGAGDDVVVGSVFKLAHRPHLSLAIAPDDSLPPALVRPTSPGAGDDFFDKAAPHFTFFSFQNVTRT